MLGVYFLLVMAVIVGASAPMITVYESAIESRTSRILIEEERSAEEQVAFAYWRDGRYPDSLADAQVLVPGSAAVDTRVRYAVERDLVGNGWTFDRQMIWVIDPTTRVNDADYLLNNACGAGAFDSAAQWCGGPALAGQSQDDYERASRQIERARESLLRTLKKFSAMHIANQEFPSVSADTGTMISGEHQTLAQIAGYAGTADSCTEPVAYEGVPFDCEDLYSPEFGVEARYHYFDSDHIGIFIVTSLRRDDGQNIIIGHELKG